MKRRFPYAELDPPGPTLPIRVSAPGSQKAVLITALVDTGADLSVLPRGLVEELALPPVGQVILRDFAGLDQPCALYAAEMQMDERTEVFQVLSFGDEALLGRDVLNHLRLQFDGPERVLELLF